MAKRALLRLGSKGMVKVTYDANGKKVVNLGLKFNAYQILHQHRIYMNTAS